MDILNFISWIKKGKRFVTQVDPAKTLIPVGLKDDRRDDEYLAGAITVEDLGKQLGCNDDTYNTGIFDSPFWYITPTMIPSCTRINDYPVAPTLLPVNLVGYKVYGMTYASYVNNYVLYVGTIEITNNSYPFDYLPYKVSGSITSDSTTGLGRNFTQAFAPGALVKNAFTGNYIPADYMGLSFENYAPGAYDIILTVAATSTLDNIVADPISFECEFLVPEDVNITFTPY